METSGIILIFLVVLLFVLLGILLVCFLSGQRCTISIQRRKLNRELTEQRQVEEEKKQQKLSSKIKRAFGSSSKTEQPVQPVYDVNTVDFSIKLCSDQKEKESQEIAAISEIPIDHPRRKPLTQEEISNDHPRRKPLTQEEINARLKRREEIRRKYEL